MDAGDPGLPGTSAPGDARTPAEPSNAAPSSWASTTPIHSRSPTSGLCGTAASTSRERLVLVLRPHPTQTSSWPLGFLISGTWHCSQPSASIVQPPNRSSPIDALAVGAMASVVSESNEKVFKETTIAAVLLVGFLTRFILWYNGTKDEETCGSCGPGGADWCGQATQAVVGQGPRLHARAARVAPSGRGRKASARVCVRRWRLWATGDGRGCDGAWPWPFRCCDWADRLTWTAEFAAVIPACSPRFVTSNVVL